MGSLYRVQGIFDVLAAIGGEGPGRDVGTELTLTVIDQ